MTRETEKSLQTTTSISDKLLQEYRPQSKQTSKASINLQNSHKRLQTSFIDREVFVNEHKRKVHETSALLTSNNFKNTATKLPNIMLDALDKYENMVRNRQKERS